MVVLVPFTPHDSPLRLASVTYLRYVDLVSQIFLPSLYERALGQSWASVQTVASSKQVFFLTLEDDEAVVVLVLLIPHDSPLRLASVTCLFQRFCLLQTF